MSLLTYIILQGKRILSLDVALLMAGAKERGELEARITSLLREVRKAGLLAFQYKSLDVEFFFLIYNL